METNCDSYVEGTTIHLFSNVSCVATTAQGKKVTLNPGQLPVPVTPASWTLVVQDWAPTTINETGPASPDTTKTILPAIHLNTLAAWPNITGLEYASGIGTYTTSVKLSTDDTSVRVLMDIGSVTGNFGIQINGKTVPGLDQLLNKPVDVTSYLVSGDNSKSLPSSLSATSAHRLRRYQDHCGYHSVEQARQSVARDIWPIFDPGDRTDRAGDFHLCQRHRGAVKRV